jgi:outer membrane protein
VILPLLLALQVAAGDSLPRVTLAQALQQGVRLDPNYVRALGQQNDADWSRRAALAALVLPSLTISTDYQNYSRPIFNIGIGRLSQTIATARVDARYEIFAGGRRLAELSRTRAELDGAQANEVQNRYASALLIESNFYDVLGTYDLLQVAQAQLQRSEEGLVVARARVVSGAAVQSDSLQLILERNQARVNVLRAEATLRVARLELGRRVGISGSVDAVPLDSLPAAELPVTMPQAVQLALNQGPAWLVARANERQADAVVRARRAAYLPTVSVAGATLFWGGDWPPDGLTRSQVVLSLSFPLWDNFQRELTMSRVKTQRDVARAVREDMERAAQADVAAAYDAYTTARAVLELNRDALLVAQENYRVQQTRYRAGASTILDLLEAQNQLTEAEAGVVRAQYAARLAVAGLEAIIGQRLFNDRIQP